ncbi:MAG: recombinase RecT [Methylophilus sp.]|uniref:recombinase RecT n=1 Tax=Methylophilus sp. TaxID=29541 RepID=UPI003F9F406C
MTLIDKSSGGDQDTSTDVLTLSGMQQQQEQKKTEKGEKPPRNKGRIVNQADANKKLLEAFIEEMAKPELHESIAACFPKAFRQDDDRGIGRAAIWAGALGSMARENVEVTRCSIKSVIGALRLCAQLGLEPGPLGLVHIMPKYNSDFGEYEVEMRIGYRGYLELMRRPGNVGDIDAVIVYEKDKFTLKKKSVVASGRLMYIWDLEHAPFVGEDPGEKIAVYATVNILDSDAHIEMMQKHDIERVKEMTKTRDDKNQVAGAWVEHEGEMWRVAVIRRLRKWVQMSSEISLAETVDNMIDVGERQGLDTFAEGDMKKLMSNYHATSAKKVERGFRTGNNTQQQQINFEETV